MLAVLLPVLAYYLGSVCSAILICRLWRLPDPRSVGSENPGTTNVYRLGGKWPALATFVFDMLKGMLPVLLAIYLQQPELVVALCAVFACLGHIFPLFFGFKGGKAVATAFGVILALEWIMGLALIIVWLAIMKKLRISSVAAIVTVCLAPILAFAISSPWFMSITLMSCTIVLRHLPNIRRLWDGNELGT
ncbi:glycerol-3-phosphate 1-O-acyltransferase PlsY [Planctobacterium marinum]|uniref:Glycerol-3-phosphate acyltransferase n=1 Tax=Planctobacterium marinum TaxID=1631968 RepID=A0AA48KPD2_9ALTE|nr:glycerol-3-phosphate acyltransferase [Planctobacterium marinum]